MPTENNMEEDVEESYPFGIYKCICGILYIWYPDSKNDPSQNFFPENVKCTCGGTAEILEKLRLRFDEIHEKLVPLFLSVSARYDFKQLMMIDAEHVHLIWNAKKE